MSARTKSVGGATMTSEEMIRIIAEKVMGWHLGEEDGWIDSGGAPIMREEEFNPTENIVQAFEAIDLYCCRVGDCWWELKSPFAKGYVAAIYPGFSWTATAEAPAMALCAALIKAAGVGDFHSTQPLEFAPRMRGGLEGGD